MLTVHSTTTLQAVRDAFGQIDICATIRLAEQAVRDLAAADAAYTLRVGEAAVAAWNDSNFRGLKSINLSALARMALSHLSIAPDEINYRDALTRLRTVIADSPEQFLILNIGNNSNVYYLSRHSQVELAKLTKK